MNGEASVDDSLDVTGDDSVGDDSLDLTGDATVGDD